MASQKAATTTTTAVTSAATRCRARDGRLTGCARVRSRVPASSSPATSRAPAPIANTAMSTATTSPYTVALRYPSGVVMSV